MDEQLYNTNNSHLMRAHITYLVVTSKPTWAQRRLLLLSLPGRHGDGHDDQRVR